MAEAEAKGIRNRDLLAKAEEMCNAYWAEYERATAARNKEI